MSHPYFDYCDRLDRDRREALRHRRRRREALLATQKSALAGLHARIAARRFPV